jgi:hypothetical protein
MGLYRRFTFAGADVAGGRWADSSTNRANATMGHRGPSASGLTRACASGNGASAAVCAVNGQFVTQRSDADFVDFGPNTLPGDWAMCTLTRYTDGAATRAQRQATPQRRAGQVP